MRESANTKLPIVANTFFRAVSEALKNAKDFMFLLQNLTES